MELRSFSKLAPGLAVGPPRPWAQNGRSPHERSSEFNDWLQNLVTTAVARMDAAWRSRQSPLPIRVCPGCQASFQPSRAGQIRCRKDCGRQQARISHGRTCQHCGSVVYSKHAQQRFCSGACHAAGRARPTPCERCGILLSRTNGHIKRLCDPCRRAAAEQAAERETHRVSAAAHQVAVRREARQRVQRAIPCPSCGKVGHLALFCSQRCREREKRRLRAAGIRISDVLRVVLSGEVDLADCVDFIDGWRALRCARRTIHRVRQGGNADDRQEVTTTGC